MNKNVSNLLKGNQYQYTKYVLATLSEEQADGVIVEAARNVAALGGFKVETVKGADGESFALASHETGDQYLIRLRSRSFDLSHGPLLVITSAVHGPVHASSGADYAPEAVWQHLAEVLEYNAGIPAHILAQVA